MNSAFSFVTKRTEKLYWTTESRDVEDEETGMLIPSQQVLIQLLYCPNCGAC